jgi:hypothetical protein
MKAIDASVLRALLWKNISKLKNLMVKKHLPLKWVM